MTQSDLLELAITVMEKQGCRVCRDELDGYGGGFTQALRQDYYLLDTSRNPEELLRQVLADLGIDTCLDQIRVRESLLRRLNTNRLAA